MEFCLCAIHCLVVNRNEVLAFVARQRGTMNAVKKLSETTKNRCDPDISRTPLPERELHHGLVLLLTTLPRS